MEAKPMRITLRREGQGRHVEIAQLWGASLLDVGRLPPGRVLVGEDAGCAFLAPAEALPGGSFPLVVADGGGIAVQALERYALSVDGVPLPELTRAGRALAVRDGHLLLHRVRLRDGERARLDLGGITFLVRPVAPERRVPLDRWKALDAPFLGVLALLLFLAAGALTTGWLSPRTAPMRVDESLRKSEGTIVFNAKPVATPTPDLDRRPFLEKIVPVRRDPEAGAGAPLVGPEGRRGRRNVTREEGGRAKGGVVDALKDFDLRDVFGGGDPMRGVDGALIGDEVADREGTGFGRQKDGPGGGGQMMTIDGIGPYGRGRGKKGDGRMPGVPGKKRDGEIDIGGETVILKTRLDPRLVEDAIARHLDAIRACYERRLFERPELVGKVVVRFEIAGSGAVAAAAVSQSTLGDRTAEACIVERVRNIRFPGFAADGTVSIVYPFLFKTDGN